MHRFFFENSQNSEACRHTENIPGNSERMAENPRNVFNPPSTIVSLSQEESRHAISVLRLMPKSEIILLDGLGHVFSAVIISTEASRVMARITGTMPDNEPEIKVTLYQGLPKADKMERIAQKCTELGVHAIQPVVFSRCDKVSGKNIDKSNQRYKRIVREAVKQCGRGYVPTVAYPIPFDDALPMIGSHGQVFAAWEEEHDTRIADVYSTDVLSPRMRDIAIVIGPEGGIAPSEIDRLLSSGARSVTLGKRILRTETAGMAALTVVMTLAGEI